MEIINISLCLSDIPKEAIKLSEKNGKKYLPIVVASRKEPDQYGNTHTVYVQQTKEERTAKKTKSYIGNGKAVSFDGNSNNNPQIDDDLPF